MKNSLYSSARFLFFIRIAVGSSSQLKITTLSRNIAVSPGKDMLLYFRVFVFVSAVFASGDMACSKIFLFFEDIKRRSFSPMLSLNPPHHS